MFMTHQRLKLCFCVFVFPPLTDEIINDNLKTLDILWFRLILPFLDCQVDGLDEVVPFLPRRVGLRDWQNMDMLW